MNAIVAGKQEKVAGSMVFKVIESLDLTDDSSGTKYFTFNSAAPWNNNYIRFVNKSNGKPTLIQGSDLSNDSRDTTIVRGVVTSFAVYAYSGSYYRWIIKNPQIGNWYLYFQSIDMGTLEIT